jgi:lipoprotein-anchoring transpeptidase ErfK/SrfK
MKPRYYQSSLPRHKSAKKPAKRRRGLLVPLLIMVVIIGALGTDYFVGSGKADAPAPPAKLSSKTTISTKTTKTVKTVAPKTNTVAVVTPVAVNACATNTLSQLILVSITSRHLYACQGTTEVYNSPVITGISYLAADLTPVGTYHIYAKETDQTLTGCDSTGCWNDHVSYWMPFLDNQYGEYGFHDATWRTPDQFGNISPDSADASHGCVECPLATAQWIYNWAPVGTTVTIEA